jgi:hypothetical protein
MAQLYDISFTTSKIASVYDEKGNLTTQRSMNEPIRLTALPYSTAKAYSGCDNFEMVPHEPEARRGRKTQSGRAKWGEAAPLKTERVSKGKRTGEITVTKAGKNSGKSSVQRAAETGDYSAAINK